MPLQDNRFLVSTEAEKTEVKATGSKLVIVVRKLLADFEKLNTDFEALASQKTDTANLKTSYKQFVEDYNVNAGIINARLNAIESLLKETVIKLNELDTI